MNKNIAILGHFAENKMNYNGQTIKTRILAEEVEKLLPDWQVKRIDTAGYKENPLGLLLEVLSAFFKCSHIIIMLSRNGRKVFFPLFYYLNKFFRRNIWHNVIGAASYDLVLQNPQWIKYMNSFRANQVELNSLKVKLESVGIHNAIVVPNFKKLPICEHKSVWKDLTFRFCTFSRVEPMKGIEDAINAIHNVSKAGFSVSLDIYGQIERGQEEWFEKIMDLSEENIQYCGIIDYEKSTEVLTGYYALLFPTRYTTEGFPGTIIDAYAAGLPVIASMDCELVTDGETGLVYSGSSVELLSKNIEKSILEQSTFEAMRNNCIMRAKLYQPETVVRGMLTDMGLL